MKAKILIMLLCLVCVALMGCEPHVRIEYEPETNKIIYERRGDIDVKGFYLTNDPNEGIHVELESSKSDMDAMWHFLEKVLDQTYLAGVAARAAIP